MSMSDVTLRPATKDDVAAIASVYTPARAAMPGVPVIHTAEEDLWFITHKMLPECTVVVAKADGIIAGVAAYTDTWLEQLYVDPAHHRKGIGLTLLEHVMHKCPGGLELWVFQSNAPARRLYESRGFRCVELTDGQSNEEKCPDARYSWPGNL